MEFKYKPDDYETKLIVIFVIRKLKKSPSYTVLSEIISACVDVNYFELQEYIQNLIDINSIRECIIEDETVYSLTKAGEDTAEFFSERISASVRERLENAIYVINNDKSKENRIFADYLPLNDTEFTVKCGILENNVKMLDFEMYAGSKERAKKICEYFKEHTNDFYAGMISLIEKGIEK